MWTVAGTEIHCFVSIGRPRPRLWSQRIIAIVSLKSLCYYSKANNWLFMSVPKTITSSQFHLITTSVLYSLPSAPVTTGLTGRQQWAEGSIDARALSHKCVCAGLLVCVCVLSGGAQVLLQVSSQQRGFVWVCLVLMSVPLKTYINNTLADQVSHLFWAKSGHKLDKV